MISILETGVVYRNPKPQLRSIHTWHPSLVRLDNGELLASFDLAQAIEALDYRTYLSRSTDEGRTWSAPVPLFQDQSARPATHSVRISRMKDGTLLGFGGRYYRDDPEEGLTNRANLGFVPMDVIQLRSDDRGRTWTGPRSVQPPLVGPAFEICHAIVELSDGRLLAPTASWKGWNGEAPNGMKAIAFVSNDGGRSWPTYLDVMDRYKERIVHWEISLIELPDGRLLAVTWAFDEKTGRSLPTPYALAPRGATFAPAQMTGLRGQTAKLLSLGEGEGRVLCLYRRDDRPGLWANLSRVEGEKWINLEEAAVWQGAASGMSGVGSNSEELSSLKFGYPSMTRLANGDVLAVFWCNEACIHNIRWVRLKVD